MAQTFQDESCGNLHREIWDTLPLSGLISANLQCCVCDSVHCVMYVTQIRRL